MSDSKKEAERQPSPGWTLRRPLETEGPFTVLAHLSLSSFHVPTAPPSLFCLLNLVPPCFFLSDSVKEPGTQTPDKMVILRHKPAIFLVSGLPE